MVPNQEQFDQFFGTNQRDGEIVLNSTERSVAQLIYTLASRKIQDFGDESSEYDPDDEPDDDPDDEPGDNDDDDNDDVESVESFDEPMQAAMENFNKVVELFKLSRSAKVAFLQKFDHWSSLRKNNIQRLKKIADEIHSDKFNCDISKVVGGSIGIAGSVLATLSLVPVLAPVTLPLAIVGGITTVAGGGVVVGTTGTEILLLKNMLEEAKTLAEKDEEDFSAMKKWFDHTQELKEALQLLIAYDLLDEMSEDLKRFNDEVQENLDSAKDKFRDLLTECIGKMCEKSKIVELFGIVFAPVVMTFLLVICLMRDDNRMVLECIAEVGRLTVGFLSGVGTGVNAGRLTYGLATKSAALAGRTAVVVTTSIFIAIGVVFDVVNVVWSTIDICNRTEPEQAMQIRKAAEGLEKEFSFIKKVYEELKKWESIDRLKVTEWKTFIVNHVPDGALQMDIKMAVKPHLSEEAWGSIRLQRYSTEGNRWLVKVPASHSHMLLRQSHLTIKTESCQVMQWTQWQTFVIHNVPVDAGQEDIRMGVRSHLPEEAWDAIKLQRLSTVGNNWIMKVPSRHSQNLVQQSRIIVKGERCSVMQ